MFRLAYPYFLLLLLLLPALLWYRHRRHRTPAMSSSALFPAAGIPASAALRLRRLVPAIKYAVLCLIVVAMAGARCRRKRYQSMAGSSSRSRRK
jgi:hypothetical protein